MQLIIFRPCQDRQVNGNLSSLSWLAVNRDIAAQQRNTLPNAAQSVAIFKYTRGRETNAPVLNVEAYALAVVLQDDPEPRALAVLLCVR